MVEGPAIIILGAPRSGTSLIQHLVRSAPGFFSPARESQHIWSPWIHPRLNHWQFEGVTDQRLEQADTEAIREQLFDQAVSAGLWQTLRKSGIYDSKVLMPLARSLGKPLIGTLNFLNKALPQKAGRQRFVDKSVHGGLWLDLILRVMPGCKVIHITRDPQEAIPSMASAWRSPERFQTYAVPLDGESVPWCFGLHRGWREIVGAPLEVVSAHQWDAVNRSILNYKEVLASEQRYLQVRLENLVGEPEQAIVQLLDYLDCERAPYWEKLQRGLPMINASTGSVRGMPQPLQAQVAAIVEATARDLGYRGRLC